ncbi:MAG: acyltransferase [Chitinophagaceae bacterium]|nr:MAG: acyltransferase [Chitinophagaceae bacterium]
MIRSMCKWIFKITGWTASSDVPPEIKKCIIIGAPHTSNWDFWYCLATFKMYGLRIRFTIKKEWIKFPFGLLMKPLGAIGIDRSPRGPENIRPSFIEGMVQLFRENEELIIVVTPEGTRKRNSKWKKGFYHIAREAKVPICMGYVDYKKKITGVCRPFYPSDYETDMKMIMDFYKTISPKFPENFAVDEAFER